MARAPEQTARKSNYLRRCVLVLESWPERRSPLECDHLARSPCIALDLFVSRQWYPVCWRNQQDRVRNHTKLVDGGRVNVVDVIASIENGRHKSGGNPLLHFVRNRHVTGCECCLSIILRQQNRNVVGRLPLTQQPAYPLQVLRYIGHDRKPRIVRIKDRCRIERPARLSRFRRGIGITVPNNLIHSEQKHPVCLSLHVQRSSAKRRRMKPRPRLGRCDVMAIKVVGGARPARK